MNYSKYLNPQNTPQTEPLKNQVANSAGGFSYEVDDWKKLDRFLILGTEKGSYYAGERQMTIKSAEAIERLLQKDGARVVARIVEISRAGRAPKNDPAIFALAMCLKKGDQSTRKAAQQSVSQVCRTGTHLFQLAEAVNNLGGWGRGTKKAFQDWYLKQPINKLEMNLVKYQNRNGWSHKDLLRKSHPFTTDKTRNEMLRWAVGKSSEFAGNLIDSMTLAKTADVHKVVTLIKEFGLPRECIPTEHLNSKDVWTALLMAGDGMPMTAMIRNLGKMTNVGLLSPLSDASRFVCKRLTDVAALKSARVHPLQILFALGTYRQGHGDKGKLAWSPDQGVCGALEDAFYLAFDAVEPTNKRWLIGLDVSGSMSNQMGSSGISCREASVALALLAMKTEPATHLMAFSSRFIELKVDKRTTLESACEITSRLPFEGTDCSLPMTYAMKNKIPVDVFAVYTDSETYAGAIHPSEALRKYRKAMGINAKLIVNGMVANDFSIADPNDAGMLDVVGFDASAPVVMADFARE